jgi:hypothetical protein
MKYASGLKSGAALLALAVAIAACGGGGGSPSVPNPAAGGAGSNGNETGGTTPPSSSGPVAADLIVSLDKAAINNSGTEKATLTVTAVDSARNVVPSAAVAVSVDSNAVFTPASGSVTGADGTFSGSIGPGGDKSNRLVRYTVKSGVITKSGTVKISGVALTATATPATPQPGQSFTLSVKVKDSAGNGIPGAAVTASGLPGFTFPAAQTSDTGEVSYVLAAPSSDGTFPISVQAAGVTNTVDVRVQTSGSTNIPPADGPVTSASAIATPVVVATNSSGGTSNQSEIRVLFLKAGNSPLPNMRVRFSVVSTALPGESLSSGGALVYSDTAGVARTSYIAATSPSPNNGVVIRACYGLDDFAADVCVNSVTTKLTVASTPVNLTIGTDNKIEKTSSGISYIKKFEIQAVNAAGNYAADVPVSAVVDVLGYWKGAVAGAPPTSNTENYTATPANGSPVSYKWCPNEDLDRNGVLDTFPGAVPSTEDINNDGFLTPRQSDVAIGFPGGNRTDATGLTTIQLQYPQNLATWLRVRITVTAGVSGSEGAASYIYVLRAAEEDASNGAFLTPPYGSDIGSGPNQGCSTAK